jgi:hypothetical protein
MAGQSPFMTHGRFTPSAAQATVAMLQFLRRVHLFRRPTHAAESE